MIVNTKMIRSNAVLVPFEANKKVIPIAIAAIMLTGLVSCMSVPAMTMAKLAPLSPLQANPAEIKVAILAPEDLVLKKGDAVMTVNWTPTSAEKTEYSYDLDVLVGNAAAPKLLDKITPGQKLSVLKLDDASVDSLRNFQAEVLAAKARQVHGKGSFTVSFKGACWTGTFPTDNRPMPFEPFIQTEPGTDYLPLFTGVDVKDLLKQANIASLPSCPPLLKKGPRLG